MKPSPAGWDISAVEATRKPFLEASTLPGKVYCSTEILDQEMERIFAKMWLVVGREEDVPFPGSYFTREIGNECVLVVRDKGDQIRALYNVCRHRGSRIVNAPEGQMNNIRCPYHGWTYGLDGKLLGSSHMEGAEDFSKEDYPLVPVRLETWEGFLFINLDDEAQPLARQIEGFPDFSRFQLDRLLRGARVTYDVAANWKLLAENYGECQHCPVAHPQLNRITDFRTGGRENSGAGFTGGPMTLSEGCTTMTLSGVTDRPPIPHLTPEDHRSVHYFNLYPNFLLSLHPDYVMTHTIWPQDPTHCHVICEFLFPREAVSQEGFDPQDAVEFWDLTNKQDWELCEIAQKGVRSRGYRPGRYQSGERSVHAFDNWYLDRMGL